MKIISVIGLGGQGISLLGRLLGYAATLDGRYASVHSSYGAEVRGGRVESKIVIHDKDIINPYVSGANIYIVLHKVGWELANISSIEAVEIYADKDLCGDRLSDRHTIHIPFSRISLEEDIPLNMLVLGFVAKKVGISLESIYKALEEWGLTREKNVLALKRGFELKI